MAYSGIVELLGVRELAEYNPAAFAESIISFANDLESSSLSYPVQENGDLFIYNYRDFCYVESASLQNIISYLKHLQLNVISDTHSCIRSAVTFGSLDFEQTSKVISQLKPIEGTADSFTKPFPFIAVRKKEQQQKKHTAVFQHIGFSSATPARLYGIIERFKGIGIFIDEENISANMPPGHWEALKQTYCFDNFYISEVHRSKYEHFLDCKLTIADFQIAGFEFEFLTNKIENLNVKSTKLSRYYIPILINIIRNFDLDLLTAAYYKDIFEPIFTKIRTVAGNELVYSAMINLFFQNKYDKLSKNDTGDLKVIFDGRQRIAGNSNFMNAIRDESKNVQIPREIITYARKKKILENFYSFRNLNEKGKTPTS